MAARELLNDITDVRTEVGICATRLTNHAILVVAECGALEPKGTVALFEPVAITQLGNSAIYKSIGVERSFRAPHIKLNTEHRQRRFNAGANPLRCPSSDHRNLVIGDRAVIPFGINRAATLWCCCSACRHVGRNICCQLCNVVAFVAVLRNGDTIAQGNDTLAKSAYLLAEVIEVVLASNILTGSFKDARQ